MDNSITVRDASKVYRIYDSPKDRLRELVSPTKKRYSREFIALDSVTLDVGKGETFGVIGRNGSGKSTLLKVICGIMKPTSGTAGTAGRISAILELGTGFNPSFSGRENVYLNGALQGFSKEEMDARYPDILDFADIGSFIDQPVRTYSSGMYVRLAFACAVSVDPDILIVDEAISVGDVFFANKCFRKISDFKEQGKTIVLVSHSMDTIQKNCGRALFLDKGKAVCVGESRDVVNQYLETVLLKGERGRTEKEGGLARQPSNAAPGEDDRCPSRLSYNKNEFRYGNFKAVITDYSMTGPDDKETFAVPSGGLLRFKYEVVFSNRVERPVYGFTIKTRDGVVAYGTNTLYGDIEVVAGEPGDRKVVEFSQEVDLAGGDYFISAGVAEQTDKGVEPVDRRYDLALLHVTPMDKSFGVANLSSKIVVKEKAG